MACETNHPWCSDVPRDEAVRAAEDAAAVPAIQHRDLPDAVAELRERVARLEAGQATIGSGDVFEDAGCGSTADEITRLTAERDAAIREMKEYRWAVVVENDRALRIMAERDAARAECARLRDRVAAAAVAPDATTPPPAPRGWLTAEEREAVEETMVDYGSNVGDSDCERIERVLRSLLARETPPRVKVPPRPVYHDSEYGDGQTEAWKECAAAYIAAIRAAGGEVEE